MNREQRRRLMKSNKKDTNKIIKSVNPDMSSRDRAALTAISNAVSGKVKTRLEELRKDPKFQDLKHVQVNYFNVAKLGIKYQSVIKKPVGMSYGDAVIKNTQEGPDQPSNYLCINVYFDEEHITTEIYQMMLGLTSKVHNWRYSESDDIYIDTLGVYIDRVDFEKQEDTSTETKEDTEDAS